MRWRRARKVSPSDTTEAWREESDWSEADAGTTFETWDRPPALALGETLIEGDDLGYLLNGGPTLVEVIDRSNQRVTELISVGTAEIETLVGRSRS